jgi:hypothetical protein
VSDDPTGKQALFSGAAAEAPDRAAPGAHTEGKEALFSIAPWRPGTVVVDCSVCKVRRRASLLEVGMRLVMGSLWFPWGKHPHWMSCASCGRRQWCRIGWTE